MRVSLHTALHDFYLSFSVSVRRPSDPSCLDRRSKPVLAILGQTGRGFWFRFLRFYISLQSPLCTCELENKFSNLWLSFDMIFVYLISLVFKFLKWFFPYLRLYWQGRPAHCSSPYDEHRGLNVERRAIGDRRNGQEGGT